MGSAVGWEVASCRFWGDVAPLLCALFVPYARVIWVEALVNLALQIGGCVRIPVSVSAPSHVEGLTSLMRHGRALLMVQAGVQAGVLIGLLSEGEPVGWAIAWTALLYALVGAVQITAALLVR